MAPDGEGLEDGSTGKTAIGNEGPMMFELVIASIFIIMLVDPRVTTARTAPADESSPLQP